LKTKLKSLNNEMEILDKMKEFEIKDVISA
jgi:hypothetical protein